MHNAINWFEIPCSDLDRAQTFYETVLGRSLRREDFGGGTMAVFPHEKPATGGCLLTGAPAVSAAADPGQSVRIYLDCMPSIDAVLARVPAAGGQVVAPKMALPAGLGFIAQLRDTEGNQIGLHAVA